MYTIKYKKDIDFYKGPFENIDYITIDREDIMMMKYVDILYKGDKNLILLNLKYLNHCMIKHEQFDYYTIINNSTNNKNIISSIILCGWLINEKAIDYDDTEYIRRCELYQDKIDYLKGSKRIHDEHVCLLLQYFIDTVNKVMEKKKEENKSLIKEAN